MTWDDWMIHKTVIVRKTKRKELVSGGTDGIRNLENNKRPGLPPRLLLFFFFFGYVNLFIIFITQVWD